MRSLALWTMTRFSHVVSPTSLTISTTQRLLKSSSRSNPATRCLRICMTRSPVTRPTAERSLHHCSFRSEKNQRAEDKLITFEESLLPSQSLSVCHVRTGRPVHELSSLGSSSRENPSRDSENEHIRILFERQKEQILANCRAEIHKHEFRVGSKHEC